MNTQNNNVCEKNCPDYKGMEILHKEQCDCSCHKNNNVEGWEKRLWTILKDNQNEPRGGVHWLARQEG